MGGLAFLIGASELHKGNSKLRSNLLMEMGLGNVGRGGGGVSGGVDKRPMGED